MRIIALIILIFGVALAGGAVFFASDRYEKLQAALQQQQAATVQPAAPTIETVPVVVATGQLQYGQKLTEKNLKIVQFAKESAPPNAFSKIEDLISESDNRIVLRSDFEVQGDRFW